LMPGGFERSEIKNEESYDFPWHMTTNILKKTFKVSQMEWIMKIGIILECPHNGHNSYSK
jgi:hypothetical protein